MLLQICCCCYRFVAAAATTDLLLLLLLQICCCCYYRSAVAAAIDLLLKLLLICCWSLELEWGSPQESPFPAGIPVSRRKWGWGTKFAPRQKSPRGSPSPSFAGTGMGKNSPTPRGPVNIPTPDKNIYRKIKKQLGLKHC
ncbi:hypothetical protein SLEP1_g15764 [Rubroshorea leprosula]|uniref:Uncharacterized protein n=1 Tax=Rubroshorea leprosula TaxID=152421 RepID=A0AAV5INH7_9ROSI|nr:hypothetical protein SLEP1_g15764 [Rubroshorea leprosula]